MTPNNPQSLLSLAARIEAVEGKIRSTMHPDAGLSTAGVATAIAMIVTLEFGLFAEVAAALKALAGGKSDG